MQTPVIDFHNHVGRYGRLFMDDDPHRFVGFMDRAGVDRACMFNVWYGDARHGNDMTARFVATYPDRFVGACFVNPHYPEEIVPELDRCFGELAMKYIKLYPAYLGRPADDPAYATVFEWADPRGMVILSHHDRWPEPRRYIGLAQRYPDIKWVIAHGGNGPFGQEDAVAAAQASPNIYLETSTSFGDGRTIEYLVEGAGEDRVIFGSDMPEQDVRYQLGRVITAEISESAKRKVLGLNAMRLLNLGD